MVGAKLIGDLCWAMENLVNKHLNGTMPMDAHAVAVVDEAVAALPQLLEQLEVGAPPAADVEAIVARAEGIAAGDIVEPPSPARLRARGMDPVLYEIFCNETRTHLSRIDTYLAAAEERGAPPSLSEDLHRAWHTLSGSASMAGATGIARIADPVQRFVRDALDEGATLNTEVVEVFALAAAWIRETVAALDHGAVPEPDPELLARIDALALDEATRDDAAARHPASPSCRQ